MRRHCAAANGSTGQCVCHYQCQFGNAAERASVSSSGSRRLSFRRTAVLTEQLVQRVCAVNVAHGWFNRTPAPPIIPDLNLQHVIRTRCELNSNRMICLRRTVSTVKILKRYFYLAFYSACHCKAVALRATCYSRVPPDIFGQACRK